MWKLSLLCVGLDGPWLPYSLGDCDSELIAGFEKLPQHKQVIELSPVSQKLAKQ